MSQYVMTPARKAALRKAQLVSARKRRAHSVTGYAFHDARQRAAIAYREGQLQHYRTQPHRQVTGQKVKALPGKAGKAGAKYVARKAAKTALKAGLTIGAATAIGYTAHGMTDRGKIGRQNRAAQAHLGSMGYGRVRKVKSTRVHPVFGASVKALPVGPKGRSVQKRRATRARSRR